MLPVALFLPIAALALPMPQDIPGPPRSSGVMMGSFTVRIVRMPVRPIQQTLPPSSDGRWVEKKSHHCISAEQVVAVSVPNSNSVDFLLDNGRRLRAGLGGNCPSLDFYSGVYVRPDDKGQICIHRDWIRSRSGSQCQINSFHTLQLKR